MGADRLLVCPLFTFIIRQNAAFVKGFFAGNAVILFNIFVEVWYTKIRGHTNNGRRSFPRSHDFYNRWEVMYMENFVTWEQLRFFAWLVFTLIQTAILLSGHHDHKRK